MTLSGFRERIRTPEDRIDPRRRQHAYLTLRRLSDALRQEARLVDGGTVLDVGCGSMPYRPLFTGRYIGIDLGAGHGRPHLFGTAESLPFGDGTVDVVLSTQHLEHAHDPAAVLDEARRVLRPDGILLLSTHGIWPHHPDPHDYWRWTDEGLCELLRRREFDVLRVHHLGGTILAAWMLASYPLVRPQRSANLLARAAATAALASANLVVGHLDTAVERRAPRPLASPGYLIAATPRVR